MWEYRYLCDVSGISEQDLEELKQRCANCLDGERSKKLIRIKSQKAYLQSMCAGLLLQKAVQDFNGVFTSSIAKKLTFRELLTEVENGPFFDNRYVYGSGGKPYFADVPMFFSLSHSGNYVYLVCAPVEVGADLQQMADVNYDSITNRFFAEDEKLKLNAILDAGERKELFFRLWTKKEAYGKYTGEGIAKVVGISEGHFGDELSFETQRFDDVIISICRKAYV